jgi:regulator of cell morphogenesis and NO signaling
MYQTEALHLSADMKISAVIINNPYLLLLLEHFSIAVPLQEKTVQDICSENNINTELFLTFASLYNGVPYNSQKTFSHYDILSIIDYLKNSHWYYAEEIYPNILQHIQQMKSVNNHKEMALVETFFNDYFSEVREHLNYENDIVFPYIIGLYDSMMNTNRPENQKKYTVAEYKEHHNDIEEKLNDLKNLLIKYLPLKNDQPIRRKLLFSLLELEYDLNIHSQIEDFILIPLVVKMELELKQAK